MALRFKVGDRVIDLATGKSGVIRLVHAASSDALRVFSVVLVDGRVVTRDSAELAADEAVAVKPAM